MKLPLTIEIKGYRVGVRPYYLFIFVLMNDDVMANWYFLIINAKSFNQVP